MSNAKQEGVGEKERGGEDSRTNRRPDRVNNRYDAAVAETKIKR